MRLLARTLLCAGVLGLCQLSPAFEAKGRNLGIAPQSNVILTQASSASSKAKPSKTRKARQRSSHSYSSRRSSAPVNEPSSSEHGFGGKKFWKEQEDN